MAKFDTLVRSIVQSDLMVKGSLRLAKVMARLLVLFTMARFKASFAKTVGVKSSLLSTLMVRFVARKLSTWATGG